MWISREQEAPGRLDDPDGRTHHEIVETPGPKPGEPYVCDFCMSTPVVHLFGARDHRQGPPIAVGDALVSAEAYGDWLACEECARLVRMSSRAALAARSADLHIERKRTPPIFRDGIRESVRQAHDAFWSNREPWKDRPLQPGEELRP